MSFRSALNTPRTNSGDVGLVKYGLSNPATVAVASGGSLTNVIDTITLGAGLWSVRVMAKVNLAIGAIVTISNFNLTSLNGATTIYHSSSTEILDVPALAVADTVEVSRSVVIKLDVPTTLTLSATAIYSGGTLSVARPPLNNTLVGGVGEYLTATKMA